MNWLILITASIISSAIILYSLWPKTPENKARKKIIFLLIAGAFVFPAGLNYYFIEQSQEIAGTTESSSFDFPEFAAPVWNGPMAGKTQQTSNQMSMSSVTARLEEKLRQNPGDIGGWILLGRSYVALGKPQKAMELFEDKIDKNPDNIDLLLSYGETLTQFNQGNVTEKANILFEKANEIKPDNPRTEYNLALYEMQHNQPQKAYDRLNKLLEDAPINAQWVDQIKQRLEAAGGLMNKPTMKQPTQAQIKEITNMSSQDQNSFIRNMVNGLAEDLKENPDNLNGWLNLARSYGVLQEWQKSVNAYKQARRLSPQDESIKNLYENALSKIANNK